MNEENINDELNNLLLGFLNERKKIEKLQNDVSEIKYKKKKSEEEILNKAKRIDMLIENSYPILTNLQREFERESELDKSDRKVILFFASLQIARQFVLEAIFKDSLFSSKQSENRIKHNDIQMEKNINKEKENSYLYSMAKDSNISSTKYRTTQEILTSKSVPYDVTENSASFNENLGGGNYHRAKTLGHDPILGWVFGVFNILTGTVTLSNLNTYKVDMTSGLAFESSISTISIFEEGIKSIMEDPKRLIAAILVQGLHIKSDINTKVGLPIPILTLFENIQREIYKNYDWLCFTRDLKIIGIQYIFSKIIDIIMIIYREIEYQNSIIDKRIYQTKTQKMILLSNSIPSSTNIVKVMMTNQYYFLDVGGILNTLISFFSVLNKVGELRRDYIFDKFEEMLRKEIE